ncbi:MAG TPA: hypothetical protein VG320_16215 [Paraburkholderia sp.]|uniref:hypothetical protein n=1 Tax=Paraburkholderia sp. TaxID=1926495 RepID=UPI002DF461C7|nr:hypothetical protein [Paraburkholderia sp.]
MPLDVMHQLTRSAAAPAAGSPAPGDPGLGLPARIACAEGLAAQAVTRLGVCALDLARTGALPAGAWVLASDGAARTVIDAARAREIDAALDLLDAIARGDLDEIHARAGLNRYFSVLHRKAIAR